MSSKKPAPSEIFQERVVKERKRLGLTQAQLGEKAGIPAGAISHFETGERKPSFENLVKIAEALGVTTDYLLGRATAREAAGEEVVALFRDLGQASAADQDFIRDLLRTRRKKGPK